MKKNGSWKTGVAYVAVIILVALLIIAWMTPHKGNNSYITTGNFIEVPGRDNLYYDPQEKIVYIIFNEFLGYYGYGYMSPYYASNGLPYKYDTRSNSIVMIDTFGVVNDDE